MTGGAGARRWLVDPLCGTLNFAAQTPLVAVNMAIVDVNCDGPLERLFLGPQLVGDPAFRSAFGPRVTSTSLAVAWVAAGRRAAYVTDGSVHDSVHFAAGIGLCDRAGYVVSDLAGEVVSTGRGLVVAADVETHEHLIEIIRPHLDAVQGQPNGSISRSMSGGW